MKRFEIKTFRRTNLKNFYHIDCYRLKDENDILEIGFKEIVGNPENIIAIEWPEKIKNILPQSALFMEFKFIDENKRQIIF
jgi:tRNA threonylcarbamoyladenosine biosynthesis protein TsaE